MKFLCRCDFRKAPILARVGAFIYMAWAIGVFFSSAIACSLWLDMRIHSAHAYDVAILVALLFTLIHRGWILAILAEGAALVIHLVKGLGDRWLYDLREFFHLDWPLSVYRPWAFVILALLHVGFALCLWQYWKRTSAQMDEPGEI